MPVGAQGLNVYHSQGCIAARKGDFGKAERFLREAQQFAQTVNDLEIVGAAQHRLAQQRGNRGDLNGARILYETVLANGQSSELIVQALRGLGELDKENGDLTSAKKHYDRSLEIAEELPDPYMVAGVLDSAARCARSQGQLAEARTLYNRAIAASHNPLEAAYTKHSVMLRCMEGNAKAADALDAECLEIAREYGETNLANTLLRNLVNQETSAGSDQSARQALRELHANLHGIGRAMDQTCAICLEEDSLLDDATDEKGSMAVWVGACFHIFHKSCVAKCPNQYPICRKP